MAKADDSPAFTRAWGALCGASGGTLTLAVPAGHTFLLKPVKFEGPCKSNSVHIQVEGSIAAPSTVAAWGGCGILCWLCFSNVNGLVLDGSGQIDGRGSLWWNHALLFKNSNNLKLSGLNVVNSPRSHVYLRDCKGVSVSGLKITAPGNSPNTDGIDASGSSQVNIVDSTIGTGDDCIAIKGGCSNINITGIICGPGHGISVGSLGENGATEQVEEVHVRNCSFTRTQNGARIKTVPGHARRITFEQITLNEAGNPIIIDQHYCDGKKEGCPDQPKAVAVSDVSFTGVRGPSSDGQAITLDCAAIGCNNIRMVRVAISSSVAGKRSTAFCRNAHGTSVSTEPAVPCLSGRAFAGKFLTQ
ncbi:POLYGALACTURONASE/GLYCOSIDE HYDROLASE FAMILY PROTEIN [Salix koriyanagi]|uniref:POLYGALACTURONASE/GLYCOSIDE HYDROLASE FAMILY PROTEIN n=1 Tax=Salix koriyanagi TaxID=2511006 RepID=A0A9Q0VD59_9ROSI|nr:POLYGALACTURONASE/GLYCOSIDE HYDROLASE FAMILY PROTEIN [Salix koriyanagi]